MHKFAVPARAFLTFHILDVSHTMTDITFDANTCGVHVSVVDYLTCDMLLVDAVQKSAPDLRQIMTDLTFGLGSDALPCRNTTHDFCAHSSRFLHVTLGSLQWRVQGSTAR